MLLLKHISIILKQLIRVRIALFFTLFFPVLLYLFCAHGQLAVMIAFVNFSIQSAMLQSVGIFTAVNNNTMWGRFLKSLPAPCYYLPIAIIIAMLIIGILGMLLIVFCDGLFFHTLTLTEILALLFSAMIGALPIGALGFCIGSLLDQHSARNALVFCNLIFLLMTFVPPSLQNICSYFFLPNTWYAFSKQLIIEKSFSSLYFLVLISYFILFLLLTNTTKTKGLSYSD